MNMPGPIRGAAVAALCIVVLTGCTRRQITREVNATKERIQTSEQTPVDVEAALLTWTELEPIQTGLAQSRGLALGPDGELYVAGDREVRILNPDGTLRARFGVEGEPRALDVAADGTVYVALIEKVLVYDRAGQLVAAWKQPDARSYLTCVDVAGDSVWVADAGQRVILHYDTAGQVTGRIGEADEARGIPGLVVPSAYLDVAAGADGNLRVSNPGRTVVEVYTPDGSLLQSWGKASMDTDGFSGCCNPTGIALLPDGSVVTAEKGLPRVKVYGPDGTLLSVVAPPEKFNSAVKGLDLAVDGAGRVLVLDPMKQQIRIFERTEGAGQ